MKHHVFISYSSYDKMIADAICSDLEKHSIQCWIAPRDIIPGIEYGEAIINAIEECIILLLVFSSKANDSPQVRREVERAISKGIRIIPFRIEKVLPTKAMEYALFNTHWLDALTPPLESHYNTLIKTIHHLLKIVEPLPSPPREPMARTSNDIADVGINDPSWIMKTTKGPGLRSGFGMVYDDKKEVTILHGGFGRGNENNSHFHSISSLSPELNDTWVWDGLSWQLLSNNSHRLVSHALAYNKATKQNLIFGGWNGAQRMDKTYILSGKDWIHSDTNNESGPGARESHSMAYDEKRKTIILFGGLTIHFPGGQSALGDTWEWNGSVWIRIQVKGPEPRWGHKMVYDEGRGAIILFGGYNGSKYFNDTWIWEGNTATWSNITTKNSPTSRCSHGMTCNNLRKSILLFGGITFSDVPLNDLWVWNGNDWNLLTEHAPPEPRCKHGFVYDRKRDKTILFGGVAGKEYFQDTWELSY